MRIVNFLWHFSTGGIGKCFLTYDRLCEVSHDLHVKSVCVILDNVPCDYEPLQRQRIEIIHIKNRKDFIWMKRMKSIVEEENPDLLFCHGFNGPIVIELLRLRYNLKIPMICTCHGVNNVSKVVEKIWMYIYKKAYVRKIICVEQFTPAQLKDYGINSNKIVTVYNGIKKTVETNPVDLHPYRIDGPIIVTASRLTRIKGVNYLIDALAVLKRRHVKFHYFCIGDGEEEANLKFQAKNCQLTDDDITFKGYQNNIPDWLAACDVFVLPSLEEYHSIAILEAMRAEKAIVATTVGGNPESLRDGLDAFMIPPKDADALVEALARLLSDKELRNTLAKSANEQFTKRFTEDIMMRNLAREILITRL